MRLPVIAITMGDPAGIGPEICLKAVLDKDVREVCVPVIVGNRAVLQRSAEQFNVNISFSAESQAAAIRVIEAGEDLTGIQMGINDARTGKASAVYIETAIELWRRGEVDAITTAPISKKALSLADYPFPGHTEFLAELTGTKRVGMSFFSGNLRVVLLSTHLSLCDAIRQVTQDNLTELIEFTDSELTRLLLRKPRLAVAGLNPHASEGGMFGSEEADEIEPAIMASRRIGVDVSGPYSPDTIFLRCYRGEFDAVIALYHDQATIPVKAIAFGSAVNVTLGLPVIRTSVDHGTAFDIAGQGIADASSMIAAVKLAAELTGAKHR